MTAYYNEHDPQKAAWLRELIKAGRIAPGEVDEQSITEVQPDDLRGFTQCHFFAGIGVWSYALRRAGWEDSRPVWTGSCPCPSFSAAGKGQGFNDPRHLWPDWIRLIRESRPATVFGEQVAAAIGHGWLDLVQTDLEAEGYAVGSAVLGAHSAGAPHIRQRLYFVATTAHAKSGIGSVSETGNWRRVYGGSLPLVYTPHATDARRQGAGEHGSGQSLFPARPEQCGDAGECSYAELRRPEQRDSGLGTVSESDTDGTAGLSANAADNGHSPADGLRTAVEPSVATRQNSKRESAGSGDAGGSAHPNGRHPSTEREQRSGKQRLLAEDCGTGSNHNAIRDRRGTLGNDDRGNVRQIADAEGEPFNSEHPISARLEGHFRDVQDWRGPGWLDPLTARSVAEAGATRGFWADCDWWYGRDGKYRPIEPGLQPLAHRATARVVRLRGYGDAICAPAAKAFIEAYEEATNGVRDLSI